MVSDGIYCALATPLNASGDLDLGGLDRLTERVLQGGVTGISPVGSTGEGSRLTAEQRHRVIERVRATAPIGFPVIAAPSTAVPPGITDEISALADLGSDAVLLAPPMAYALGDRDVRRYYETVAEKSALPIVMYHIPHLTGVPVTPAVVAELAHHERIVGIKDSSRDFDNFQLFRYASADAAEFRVFTGSDSQLLAAVVVGGAGAIAASANVVPELGTQLYAAARNQDWPTARALQERLHGVVSAARAAGYPTGWKAALEICGVCSGYPAPPALPLDPERRATLRARLRELEVRGA